MENYLIIYIVQFVKENVNEIHFLVESPETLHAMEMSQTSYIFYLPSVACSLVVT